MIIKMKDPINSSHVHAVLAAISTQKMDAQTVSLPFGDFIIGSAHFECDSRVIKKLPGVEWLIDAPKGPVLAALERNPDGSTVPLGMIDVGGETLAIIAGPCSVEDKRQLMTAARFVAAYGATALRGGAFKPRSSPYSFQGLGLEGLALLQEAGRGTHLPVVTEAMEPKDVETILPYVDCLQVGARSMQNFPLLRAVGQAGKPVLLKRGPASSLSELVLAAEYILLQGNSNVILCERGIRTFENSTRNTLDLNAVPVLKSITHLPVIVDPSHGTGRRDAVIPMARAAVAAGADGLIVEVHPNPDMALSDGDQSLTPAQFRQLVNEVKLVAEAVGRKIDMPSSTPLGVPTAGSQRRTFGWGRVG